MNLVDEINLTVMLSEFVFRINKNKPLLSCNLLTTLEQPAGIILHNLVIFFRYNALCNYFFFGNIKVMPLICFCSRRNDRFWETLILLHSVRKFHSAYLTTAILIVAPCRTCKNTAYNHLHS